MRRVCRRVTAAGGRDVLSVGVCAGSLSVDVSSDLEGVDVLRVEMRRESNGRR